MHWVKYAFLADKPITLQEEPAQSINDPKKLVHMEEPKQTITACPLLDLFHMEANSKLQYWGELRGQTWAALSMDKDHQAVVLG